MQILVFTHRAMVTNAYTRPFVILLAPVYMLDMEVLAVYLQARQELLAGGNTPEYLFQVGRDLLQVQH